VKHLDWISAALLLAGVIGLRYKVAEAWLLCAASCVAAIVLFWQSRYQGRRIYGKLVQSSVMLVINLSNWWAWL
jgi:hypothetical protein